MLPLQLVPLLESTLTQTSGKAARIEDCQLVGGGSINKTCLIRWAGQSYFLKYNEAGKYPKMFAKEASGLALLRNTKSLKVPQVQACVETESSAFLLMEAIPSSSPEKGFWHAFGKQLADLHSNTSVSFGLETDNYIGSLAQANKPSQTWHAFFIEQRLRPLVNLAHNNQRLNRSHLKQFETLFSKMNSLFPEEKPALLHGDLWRGNFLCDVHQQPVLIDPAVSYGHREMDIAMSKLFGGFDRQFYLSYNEHFPMEKGWEKRLDLCNLYPLLVHVNLFGRSYLYDIEPILRYYAG